MHTLNTTRSCVSRRISTPRWWRLDRYIPRDPISMCTKNLWEGLRIEETTPGHMIPVSCKHTTQSYSTCHIHHAHPYLDEYPLPDDGDCTGESAMVQLGCVPKISEREWELKKLSSLRFHWQWHNPMPPSAVSQCAQCGQCGLYQRIPTHTNAWINTTT